MPPTTAWIPVQNINAALQLEPMILLLVLTGASWLVYRYLLKEISPERHRNLRLLFKNLFFHIAVAVVLLAGFWLLEGLISPERRLYRVAPTLGLFALISCCTVFVKVCRIITFEYLFFKSMRTGVPVLIVNLLTLLLSLVLTVWVLGSVFNFQVAPLLATSAVFSIVVGLALQDTLGNLIAGVALQLDKPYGIGDWIEVQNGAQRWVGQVREISWRAANLIGFLEETITIPNRIMSQAEIANYSGKDRPFLRGQIFRISYGHSHEVIREALLAALEPVTGVRKLPQPMVLFYDSTESYMTYKLVYSIHDFGAQYIIADQVNVRVVSALAEKGIYLASPRLVIEKA